MFIFLYFITIFIYIFTSFVYNMYIYICIGRFFHFLLHSFVLFFVGIFIALFFYVPGIHFEAMSLTRTHAENKRGVGWGVGGGVQVGVGVQVRVQVGVGGGVVQ